MKKLIYYFLIFLTFGALAACDDEDIETHPDTEDVPLVIPKISQDNNAYILGDPSSTYGFTVELDPHGVDVASVEVYKTFVSATAFTPRQLVTTLTTFPAGVSVPLSQAIENIMVPNPEDDFATEVPLSLDLLEEEDFFIYTFEVVRTDGRRIIYTPLDATGGISGTQIFEPYAVWAVVVAP